jgi:hypothetical protein
MCDAKKEGGKKERDRKKKKKKEINYKAAKAGFEICLGGDRL